MGCQFSSIGKMVARSVGKHSVPVNAVRRPRRRFPRNSTTPAQRVLAQSPYATNMGRSYFWPTSQMGRFETEWLTRPENLIALADLPGRWIDKVHTRCRNWKMPSYT